MVLTINLFGFEKMMLNLGSKDLIGEPFCYSVLNKVPNAELTINNGSEMKEGNLKPTQTKTMYNGALRYATMALAIAFVNNTTMAFE